MEYSREDFYNAIDDMHLSWDTQSIIENILDRIENPNDDEDIMQAIDDELIYYDDQWAIMKEYFTPQEACWENAIEFFINDVYTIVGRIQKL